VNKEQLEMLVEILIDAFVEGVKTERVFGKGIDAPEDMAKDWLRSTSLGGFVQAAEESNDTTEGND
jgi:hypothetical protein